MSNSPRVKWPSTSPETQLHAPYPPIQSTSITHNNEHKEIENDDNNNEQSQPKPEIINNENTNNNIPFHLSHHHLVQNNNKLHFNINDPSPQNTMGSSGAESIGSHNLYPLAYSCNNRNQMHSHIRNNAHDKLQRKCQKLEQDVLSKNIQHDIMVNKEEMMSKRLKTKDIRIKNLQNDIHKLREQLTAKNETQEKLMTEMSGLQTQNRTLNNKLRESNIGLNVSNVNNENINHYNESMRDMLLNITSEINQLKEPKQPKQSNHSLKNIIQACLTPIAQQMKEQQREFVNEINQLKEQNQQSNHSTKNIVQSCLAPIVQQMKDQQREFMNALKNDQSEWMNTTMIQINENMNKYDMNDSNNENENDINIFTNKLDELSKIINKNINAQQIKLDSLNTNYFQRFFSENNKLMQQNQQILMNELKKEIHNIKNELMSNINETKNEIDLNISKLSPIRNNNNENMDKNNIIYDKINNFEKLLNDLYKNNKNIEQQLSIQHNKFKQISDINTDKTNNAVLALKPLFNKLYEYFQTNNNKIIQSMQQNCNDQIQSFTQFKHELKKIIESIINSKQNNKNINDFDISNINDNDNDNKYEILLKEIKTMSKSSEFNIISKNMEQISRRNDEIVKIITNTINNKQLYNNLSKAIESMNNWHINNTNLNISNNSNNNNNKPFINISNNSNILKQIEEIKKSFNIINNNISIKFDKLLQEINSRNIKLFNNIKQISDNKQNNIIKQNDINNKKIIKSHEDILKHHLKQIQLRLNDLNKTINNKNTNNNANITKDIQLYLKNDMIKEIQLIKNLCNDIHKKSQQLPHIIAKRFKKI